MLSAPDRDSLEPRVRVERSQDVADVVPDGLGAEVERTGDLLGRAAVLQKLQHLGLPRRKAWVGRQRRFARVDVLCLAEDVRRASARRIHRFG